MRRDGGRYLAGRPADTRPVHRAEGRPNVTTDEWAANELGKAAERLRAREVALARSASRPTVPRLWVRVGVVLVIAAVIAIAVVFRRG